MAPKKPIKPPIPDPDQVETGEDAEEQENQLPWDEDIALWKQEEMQDGDYFKLILYRRLDNNRGKEKVWEWVDENPGSHDIGLQFGGGKYTAWAILPGKVKGKPRIRVRHFILANSYTERKRIQDRENGLTETYAPTMGGRGPQVSQVSEMEKIALIFEKMVFPMMGLMQQAQPAPAAAHGMGDFKNMFSQMAGTVNQIVMESAKSSIAMNREIGREMAMLRNESGPAAAAGAEAEAEDDASDFDWKDFLKEALQEYGPELLELTGIKKKIAAAKLQKEEIFQTLAQNKTLFDRVYGLLVKDPDVNKDQVDRVLQRMVEMGLGFNVKPAPAGGAPVVPVAPAAAPVQTNGYHTPHSTAAIQPTHAR